jgi:hypothetical protein
MWACWDAAIVNHDLARLADLGIKTLRVFPLWPDFQPIHQLRSFHMKPQEIRLGEDPLPDDEPGRSGINPTALAHLVELADLAAAHGQKLIVGLVTGWMSSRLFVPPALDGLNPITDARSMMWQARMVKALVTRLREHPAITAWDLGNECNCMGPASREEAWRWTQTISDAIRSADPTRPVISGMHSLPADPSKPWSIRDQGELTDLLTIHPYPSFTPHCDLDELGTIRSCMHSTAEARLYADLSGKPCLVEEIGSLGPMFGSSERAASYIRACLLSLWAHDGHGLLWWCAHDQDHLAHAPYDWNAVERELGLLDGNGRPKPAALELQAFGRWLESLPRRNLPARHLDAVGVLTPGQDAWAAALGCFTLAKQAGLDLRFAWGEDRLPNANAYLLPCLAGDTHLPRRRWLELLDRVRKGARLYVSLDNAIVSGFEALTGMRIEARSQRLGPAPFRGTDRLANVTLSIAGKYRLRLTPAGAQVMGKEPDGNPLLTCHSLGAGEVWLLAAPLETAAATRPAGFEGKETGEAWRLYAAIFQAELAARAAAKDSPRLGLTEHDLPDNRRALVLINYSPDELETRVTLRPGWKLETAWRGPAPTPAISGECPLKLQANDGAVWILARPKTS